jgi:formate hydrogenlyase subunit 4
MTTASHPFALQALQVLIALLASPMLTGWIRVLKCRTQARSSAGLFQPYRDLVRLFSKDIVLAHNASWIFRFTPYLVFGAMLTAGALIPTVSADVPLAGAADIIVLAGLFAAARFFTALAGMDTGTAFGGMGSSREMMVAALAEPALLMSVFTVSFVSGSTSLAQIAHTLASGPVILRPSLAFALLAFVMVAVAETGRIPVDNPATHLELTMIHEAMILEYSGRHLALVEWAGMMKIYLFASLGMTLFFPWGMAGAVTAGGIGSALAALLVKTAGAGVFVVIMETGLAKMRLFRLTEFLGSAFLLATLGMLSYFILE